MYYPDDEEKKNINEENNDAENVEEASNGDVAENPQEQGDEPEEQAAPSENEIEEIVVDNYTVKEERPYEQSPSAEKQPEKKKGTSGIGPTLAILMVCLIVFVAVMSVGIWKVVDYIKNPVSTTASDTTVSNTANATNDTTQSSATTQQTDVKPSGQTPSDLTGVAITPNGTVTSDTTTPETDMIAYNIKASVEITLYVGDTVLGYGSGTIYTTDGYILTNYHVVSNTTVSGYTVVVTLYDGSRYNAEFICGDMESDVSVIKIDKNDCVAAKIGNSNASVIGERVYAIGNPNGSGITVTEGILSAKDRSGPIQSSNVTIVMENQLLITAPINAGNSGGGLFNAKGELIGIVNSKSYYDRGGNVVEGEGMAIPIAKAVDVIDILVKNDGYIPGRAKLGVVVNINGKTLSSGWTSVTYSTYVRSVNENSSAALAGIQAEDIITALGGVNLMTYKNQNGLLNDYDALHALLMNYSVGDTTTITVLRPETTTSSYGGYQQTTYKEITMDITFVDFNYSK